MQTEGKAEGQTEWQSAISEVAERTISPEELRSRAAQISPQKRQDGLPRGVKRKGPVMTAKMRAFTNAVAKGMSPKEAYKRSYDTSAMGEASIQSCSNRLMKDPRVTALLESLWEDVREAVITDAATTRRHVMSELHKAANDPDVAISVRLRALELMGK
ncbi:hypothetical protein UFOVP274_84, partial [uncultured Caudovirales phage]